MARSSYAPSPRLA